MVGVLIEMRAATMRRQTTGKYAVGVLVLVLFVMLVAAGTLAAGLKHYHYAGAGANVVATLCFGWLVGWVSGPLVTGDNAALRMDYFKLLPVPARKLCCSPSCSPRSADKPGPGPGCWPPSRPW